MLAVTSAGPAPAPSMRAMSMLRRIAPGLLLLVLAPLLAEFLLGDFSLRSLGLLVIFIPQYGGGALLVRELARRTGRGWPTIVMLALAYGLIEEGFTTQSLFNPNYVGQRLLDYGYVPALGTSPAWAVFVLTLHVVWSICTPILIAEGVAGARRTTPWLGRIGMVVVPALFVLGCVITTGGTISQNHFVSPAPQLVAVAILTVIAIVAAFALFRPGAAPAVAGRAPSPWVVGAASLVLASAFEVVRHYGQDVLPAAATVLAMLALAAIGAALLAWWSRRSGWSAAHYLATAAGTVLTYGWSGLTAFLAGRTNLGEHVGPLDVAGQVLLVLVFLALIAWGAVRGRQAGEAPATIR